MPHLKTLVKRNADRPFAVIGINTYDDETDFRKGMKELELPWACAFQGSNPVITDLFGVDAFPTYILVDHEGRILSVGGAPTDEELARALQAADAAGK